MASPPFQIELRQPQRHIIHDNHSPELCAMLVRQAVQRNDFLQQHNLDLLQEQCDELEALGKVKVENASLKLDNKLMAAKVSAAEDELQEIKEKLEMAEEKLPQINERNAKLSLALEELQMESEDLNKENHLLETEKEEQAVKIEELTRKLKDALLKVKSLTENGVHCLEEAKAYAAGREEEFAAKLAELEQKELWLEQQKIEVNELRQDFDLWVKEKDHYETELAHLRDSNRNLRFKVSHPNKKPETNELKIELNKTIADAEELRRQLHKMNLENIEMQRQMKEYNIRTSKRMTFHFQKSTSASSSKK